MGDEADVRLVDPHAEGDGGNQYQAVLAEEGVLVPVPRRRIQPGMIGQGPQALAGKPARRFLDGGAAQAVDDAALALMAAQEGEKLPPWLDLGRDRVGQVRPVETRDEQARPVEPEAARDVIARLRIGRGGECDAGHARKSLADRCELEIFGPEIMAPLADAVGFVDREECDPHRP